VEIEEGIEGMIHISDLSWTQKYNHPSEALEKGQTVKCVVLDIDQDKQRISLGIKQLTEDPWAKAIPSTYIPGHIIKGKVSKITNFGAFVELEPGLEGLLHISELADHKIDKPQDIVEEGQEIEVKILKVDTDTRKIGLSLRRAQWAAEEKDEHSEDKEKKQKPRSKPDVETVISNDQLDKFHSAVSESEDENSEEAKQDEDQPEQEDKDENSEED
jgi:small subunit ribosomal protein S1